ncbi:MAG TPA: helix-turn-helix transcriptional regulator [Solirubrobacterales bacterium]|nr:helix-turn-helix transcriptional regulator [Solirubrobacterales bacterium]
MADATKTGQEIKERREQIGYSLSQLAERAEISKGYLWKLESGDAEVRPSAETLYRIARALGTSMSELMGRSVLVDQAEELPQALIEFAEDEGLGERDKAMLAQINFRGKQPERPEDWAFIWHAIRRSIPESERKRPSAKKKPR